MARLRSLLIALAGIAFEPASAQLVLDGTLGPAGEIPELGGEFHVTDDHGVFSPNGSSRYHSFSRFDVPSRRAAVLSSVQSPARVFIRVTEPGPNAGSQISGTLRSTIPGADLYFINPFGISFGQNSELDLQGSAHFSTADVLRFGGGAADFPADRSTPPVALLADTDPSHFGFTMPGADVASATLILTDGLRVPEGETLSLLADNVLIRNAPITSRPNIRAPGATLQIAAVSGEAELPLDLASLDPAELQAVGDCSAAGCVRVEFRAAIDVSSGADPTGVAGELVIRAGRFELDNARIVSINTSDTAAAGPLDIGASGGVSIANGATLGSESRGAGAGADVLLEGARIAVGDRSSVGSFARGQGLGGDIVVRGGELAVSNPSGFASGGLVTAESFDDGGLGSLAGAGGDIDVQVDRFVLTEGGQLQTATHGTGDAGELTVAATSVEVSGVDAAGRASALTTRALEGATGSGGDLSIDADTIDVANGAALSAATFGAGAAGDVALTASQSITVRGGAAGASTVSAASRQGGGEERALGPGGDLLLNAPLVALVDGGQLAIDTGSTLDAGTLEVRADSISISGVDPASGNPSGAFAASSSRALDGGAGGRIDLLSTGDLEIREGALVSVVSQGGGDAGSARLDAGGRLTLASGAGVSAEGRASGDGGSLDLRGGGGIVLRDGASVSAIALSEGNAGSISVDAGPRLEMDDASIATEARQASGGRVEVFAREAIALRKSEITTSVQDGTGGGGDISIDHPEVMVLESSRIIARAFAGRGGNIDISTGTLLLSPDSEIDASSQLGIDGEVSIESPNSELTGKLTTLPQSYLNASELLGDPCLARSGPEGSFVVGRQSIPAPPDAPFTPQSGTPEPSCAPAEEIR